MRRRHLYLLKQSPTPHRLEKAFKRQSRFAHRQLFTADFGSGRQYVNWLGGVSPAPGRRRLPGMLFAVGCISIITIFHHRPDLI